MTEPVPARSDQQNLPGLPAESQLLRAARERTPARIFVGRDGGSYDTSTWLALREDHAAAADAVRSEIELTGGLASFLGDPWNLLEVKTQAGSKSEYILRPDLGRRLSDAARDELTRRCPTGCDLQIVIGDGLSAAAVVSQVPCLVPLLVEGARREGWRTGQLFFVRYCRVGVMNDIGDLLRPGVVVLLIGERPGLATAESLSAYLGYRPQSGLTDAERNLISNIHRRGVSPEMAAKRILALARQMMHAQTSGIRIKEASGILPAVGSDSIQG